MTAIAAGAQKLSTQDLTVVLIQLAGASAAELCRRALSDQVDRIILVRPADGDPGESLPARRLRGLHAATTPLVAFLEDTCTPGPDWCSAICNAFGSASAVGIGGPVEIAPRIPARFRALGICEYARFQRARLSWEGASVSAPALAGCNFAVRKSAMADASSPLDMIDNAMFAALRSRGEVVMVRGAGVSYAIPDLHGARLSTRFHHGRIYGGGRTSKMPILKRVLVGLRTILAPALLTFRSCRDAPAWFWRSPSTIMWVVLMHTAWSAGELTGALTGRIGASLKEWV